MLTPMNKTVPTEPLKISADLALEHLDAICKSPFFVSSKRCQEFIRYVVRETLEGREDLINERNIAHEVFGKGINFEPDEHSLVRVKAGDVRKRLSDYYESTPDSDLRIELPLGGYVPRICDSRQLSVAGVPSDRVADGAAKLFSRRNFFWMAGAAIGSLGAVSLVQVFRKPAAPLDLLWRPVFATKEPLLIFIPVMNQKDGSLTEWVGLGPAATLGRAAEFLTRHNRPYSLRFGDDLTFSQLREQPSLLLGGLFSPWTQRITRDLRFAPTTGDDTNGRALVDRQTKQLWKPVKRAESPYVDVDYGMLCRLFDAASGQIILLAVGTQTFGTEGAASLLFDPDLFSELLKQAPANWETKNFQALVRVSVIGTTPSSPQLVASHFW
jgi:hypothetical protein